MWKITLSEREMGKVSQQVTSWAVVLQAVFSIANKMALLLEMHNSISFKMLDTTENG